MIFFLTHSIDSSPGATLIACGVATLAGAIVLLIDTMASFKEDN